MPPHFAAPVPPGAARMYSGAAHNRMAFGSMVAGRDGVAITMNRYSSAGAKAKGGLRRDHERPQVQVVPTGFGHPGGVGPHQRLDRRDEVLFGQRGHGHPARRVVEPAGMVAGGRNTAR